MNNDFETHELLRATHQFPCTYLFKAIGRDEGDFAGGILRAVRQELGEAVEPPFNLRRTANRKHLSVSIEPTVDGPEQIFAIYENIKQVDGLLMLL